MSESVDRFAPVVRLVHRSVALLTGVCLVTAAILYNGPLMMAGGLLLLAGLMMFSTGLLGEVLIRTYFETQDRRIYAVRQILAKKERRAASGR